MGALKFEYGRKRLPKWALDAEKLFKQATRAAVKTHLKAGNPVYVVKDGRVVRLTPR